MLSEAGEGRGDVHATRGRALLLVCAVAGAWALPAAAAERPAGIVPALQGPFAYVAGPIPRGLDVRATLASARIELHPDFAVVEQTLTLQNNGKTGTFWLGVDQPRRWTAVDRATDAQAWAANPLLGAAAWVDGVEQRETRLQIAERALDDEGGYTVGLRLELPGGEHVVTVAVVVQTVPDSVAGGVRRPAGTGRSAAVVGLDGLGLGFGAEDLPLESFRVVLSPADGVSLDDMVADEWTEGAKGADGRVFWSQPVRLVLGYRAAAEVARATTIDELRRDARATLARPPRGHVAVPAGATPWLRPEDPMHPSSDDALRARRALLVPAGGLFLLVLVMYLFRRRKERRR